MNKYNIGIVGYGDFTKLMCEYLAPYANIVVGSRSHDSGDAGHGAAFAPLEQVLACDIIIPSIPSQFFEQFFAANKGKVNPQAVVLDVCSVKVKPLEVLVRLLPETCQIIGTHPLFGPASVDKNGGIVGLRCVLSNVRTEGEVYEKCKAFLRDILHLTVIEKTPEQHDKDMAYVQGLSHYIGRVMDGMNIPETELATLAYEDLLDMKRVQGKDSWELFASIMNDNPYAGEVHDSFKKAMTLLDERIRLAEN